MRLIFWLRVNISSKQVYCCPNQANHPIIISLFRKRSMGVSGERLRHLFHWIEHKFNQDLILFQDKDINIIAAGKPVDRIA